MSQIFYYRGQAVKVLENGKFATTHLGELHVFTGYYRVTEFIDWMLEGNRKLAN